MGDLGGCGAKGRTGGGRLGGAGGVKTGGGKVLLAGGIVEVHFVDTVAQELLIRGGVEVLLADWTRGARSCGTRDALWWASREGTDPSAKVSAVPSGKGEKQKDDLSDKCEHEVIDFKNASL